VAESAASTRRLTKFYGEMSPTLDTVMSALSAADVDLDHLQANDLYRRDLDCHNLGMHRMLEVLKDVAAEYGNQLPTTRSSILVAGLEAPDASWSTSSVARWWASTYFPFASTWHEHSLT
jgi:hypothetical protein